MSDYHYSNVTFPRHYGPPHPDYDPMVSIRRLTMSEHDLYHERPDYRGIASVTRQLSESFTYFAWGSGTPEQWQRRCEESQYRSNLRRMEGDVQRRYRWYQVALVILALVTLAVVVGYLVR
jgi:hypothetical protein